MLGRKLGQQFLTSAMIGGFRALSPTIVNSKRHLLIAPRLAQALATLLAEPILGETPDAPLFAMPTSEILTGVRVPQITTQDERAGVVYSLSRFHWLRWGARLCHQSKLAHEWLRFRRCMIYDG